MSGQRYPVRPGPSRGRRLSGERTIWQRTDVTRAFRSRSPLDSPDVPPSRWWIPPGVRPKALTHPAGWTPRTGGADEPTASSISSVVLATEITWSRRSRSQVWVMRARNSSGDVSSIQTRIARTPAFWSRSPVTPMHLLLAPSLGRHRTIVFKIWSRSTILSEGERFNSSCRI